MEGSASRNAHDDGHGSAEPWQGLLRLPEKSEVVSLLKELRESGREQITVLLLGKSGVGKSSLVNSLLGEQVARVQAFKLQAEAEAVTIVERQVAIGDPEVDELRVTLIDTCGLEDSEAGDTVNVGALTRIAEELRGVPIDVVLYVDRLDLYRVDPLDQAIISAISERFGGHIWRRAILVLTHANLQTMPPAMTYDSYVDGRIRSLRRAVTGGLPFRRAPPAVLVECSDTCPTDPKTGHRVLPDGSDWAVGVFAELVEMALAARRPYKCALPTAYPRTKRLQWLLPVIIGLQLLAFKRVLQPAINASQRRIEDQDRDMWSLRRKQRAALGLHMPNEPRKDTTARLGQMYDDE